YAQSSVASPSNITPPDKGSRGDGTGRHNWYYGAGQYQLNWQPPPRIAYFSNIYAIAILPDLPTYSSGQPPVNGLPQFGATDATAGDCYAQGFPPAGILVGLGDGSVRVVAPGINVDTWCWACNPADDNTQPTDW